jgi:outer membrane protein TolC
MMLRRTAWMFLLMTTAPVLASAQIATTTGADAPRSGAGVMTISTGADGFRGSVPRESATPGERALSLRDAVALGLRNNLGMLLREQDSRSAQGDLWKERSALLPNLAGRTSETLLQNNLQAFGFPSFPGVPTIIGPFGVFDARVSLEQSVVDLSAWRKTGAARAASDAASFTYQDARELVVWAVSNLYFRVQAAAGRAAAVRSQVETAEALFHQAQDFKDAGTVPAIEVLRAQVEFEAQQQRLIYYQNELEKAKLDLARAIGLPAEQQLRLTDEMSATPPPPVDVAAALGQALAARADYQSLAARVREAELNKQAAESERLPKITARGDYGAIGRAPGISHGTFAASAGLEFPIFQGGRIRGNVIEKDAELESRQAELADLRGRIEQELRVALLDLNAASQQVSVARTTQDLATQQMTQSRDRFAAGVASNIEVVQAQEALAAANDNYISSLYSLELAKASLGRATGAGEKRLTAGEKGDSQ